MLLLECCGSGHCSFWPAVFPPRPFNHRLASAHSGREKSISTEMLRTRSASASRARRIRSCSSGLSELSPNSKVQILKRLTPDRRARRLWEMRSALRWTRRFVTAIVLAWIRLNKQYRKNRRLIQVSDARAGSAAGWTERSLLAEGLGSWYCTESSHAPSSS